MKRRNGKSLAAGLLAAVCLACAGCTPPRFEVAAPEDLYSLPRLPVEYAELNSCIKALLDQGAEYAAPVSGASTQSVQQVDLNGDGEGEALAFLRNEAEEKPLKLVIFSPTGDGYEQSMVIEGSGTSFYSIAYRDLNGDGYLELLVGWKVGTDLQALTVYNLRGGRAEELLRSNYVKYAAADLDPQRAHQEIVVLRADEEGNGVADFYTWGKEGDPDAITKSSSARLSMTMAELNSGRVTSGMLEDGSPALFVTGVSDSGVAITDILVTKEGELTNAVLSDTTGVSTALFRHQALFPTDINGDGATEVPAPTALPTHNGGLDFTYLINWRSYDRDGTGTTVHFTYHNIDDGWYLEVPDNWISRIVATRSQMGTGESAVTFAIRGVTEAEDEDFLRICTITGDNREVKASRNGRFVIGRMGETIYAAELLEANSRWSGGISEEELRSCFKLITTEWRAGDN